MVVVDVDEVLIEEMTGDCLIDVPEVLVEERAEEDDNVASFLCERFEVLDSRVYDIIIVRIADEKMSMAEEVGRE